MFSKKITSYSESQDDWLVGIKGILGSVSRPGDLMGGGVVASSFTESLPIRRASHRALVYLLDVRKPFFILFFLTP